MRLIGALLFVASSASVVAAEDCETPWFYWQGPEECRGLLVKEREMAVLVREGTGGVPAALSELERVGASEFRLLWTQPLLFHVPNASAAPGLLMVLRRSVPGRRVFDIVRDGAERVADRFWAPVLVPPAEDEQQPPDQNQGETPLQQILVSFVDGTSLARIEEIVEEEIPGASFSPFLFSHSIIITPGLRSGVEVLELAVRLHLRAEVKWAEPNFLSWGLEGPSGFDGGGGGGETPFQVPVSPVVLVVLSLLLAVAGWRIVRG